MTHSASFVWVLGGTLTAYVLALYAMCFRIQGRIQSTEDFLVAGRNLTLPFATATILATWFGAGTVLTAADEVRRSGLQSAALEPVGAGVCLLLAGFFVARPIWELKLLTLSDLFRARFGARSELLSACILIPSYFGWVAAQFVALAGVLNLFFGIEMTTGIALVAVIGIGYTLLGGMWSVTLTDALQMALVLAGLVLLGITTTSALGDGSVALGLRRLWSGTPPEMRQLVPHDSLQSLVNWLSVLAVGALGNLPSQDLVQRIFASRDASIARRACLYSGSLYILFGLVPVAMGLAGRLLFPDSLQNAILPALANTFTQPVVAVVFTVVLVSAVLSSIDSGILAPAAVLSENVLKYRKSVRLSPLALNRWAVLIVGAGSLVMAFAGKSAYALLEEAYALPLVSLFVPMVIAVRGKRWSARAAVASMVSGAGVWLAHKVMGWEYLLEPWTASRIGIPVAAAATLASLIAYVLFREPTASPPVVSDGPLE